MRLSDESVIEGRHLTPEERIALQAEEIKQLQQENNGWQERYYELDAGHSRLFKDFCKLQKENEQLQARVREALRKAREEVQNALDNYELVGEHEYDISEHLQIALTAIDKVIGGKEDA